MRRHSGWLIFGAVACALFALALTDERNRLVLFSQVERLTDRTTLLGVNLGMSKLEAEAALRNYGFTPIDATIYSPDYDFGDCGDASLAAKPIDVLILSDNSWRGGGACLATIGERVVALSISYMPITF